MDTTIEREAQTTLAQLLERVAQGERITITENGVPVAVMKSPDVAQPYRESVREMQAFEEYNLTRGDCAIRDAINEGRV